MFERFEEMGMGAGGMGAGGMPGGMGGIHHNINMTHPHIMSPHMNRKPFGGAGMRGQQQEQPQDAPVEYDLPVTLDELLTGTTKKMKITRDVLSKNNTTTTSEQKVGCRQA